MFRRRDPASKRNRKPLRRKCFCHSSSRLDLIASDIETCKHVSASLDSFVIPLTGLDLIASVMRKHAFALLSASLSFPALVLA